MLIAFELHRQLASRTRVERICKATANAAFSARRFHRVVAFNAKMWLMGGSTGSSDTALNDVWSSSDGINWTQSATDPGLSRRVGQGMA